MFKWPEKEKKLYSITKGAHTLSIESTDVVKSTDFMDYNVAISCFAYEIYLKTDNYYGKTAQSRLKSH